MTRIIAGAALPALLVLSASASAQEWQVARDQFPFAGSRLEIRVDVESRGSLRILRGEPGNVRVAGRAPSGFTAAGLTADEELTLTALSDGPVDFMVTVPEDVWITLRLPDRHLAESLGGHDRGRTFEWKTTARTADGADELSAGRAPAPDPAGLPSTGPATDAAAEAIPAWLPPAWNAFEAPLFTTFTDVAPPAEVVLPDLRWVRSVTIRLEGPRFRVATSRPLHVERGDPRRLEIRPAGPPMDVVLVLPEGTRAFTLRAAGATALQLEGTDLTTRCAPVTQQWLSHGRRWVTFTPVEGVLQCGPQATLRHEG